MGVPANMWECPNCGDFVDDTSESCPHCGGKQKTTVAFKSTVTFSSAESQSMPSEKWILEPAPSYEQSWAATFLIVIAVILFVGGLIVSIMSARIEVPGYYYSHTEFSWLVFFETYLIYALLGCFTLCASELFSIIQSIANSLRRMEIKKK